MFQGISCGRLPHLFRTTEFPVYERIIKLVSRAYLPRRAEVSKNVIMGWGAMISRWFVVLNSHVRGVNDWKSGRRREGHCSPVLDFNEFYYYEWISFLPKRSKHYPDPTPSLKTFSGYFQHLCCVPGMVVEQTKRALRVRLKETR